jgi:hypothetical protein
MKDSLTVCDLLLTPVFFLQVSVFSILEDDPAMSFQLMEIRKGTDSRGSPKGGYLPNDFT